MRVIVGKKELCIYSGAPAQDVEVQYLLNYTKIVKLLDLFPSASLTHAQIM
jgi:hypothetical protein